MFYEEIAYRRGDGILDWQRLANVECARTETANTLPMLLHRSDSPLALPDCLGNPLPQYLGSMLGASPPGHQNTSGYSSPTFHTGNRFPRAAANSFPLSRRFECNDRVTWSLQNVVYRGCSRGKNRLRTDCKYSVSHLPTLPRRNTSSSLHFVNPPAGRAACPIRCARRASNVREVICYCTV